MTRAESGLAISPWRTKASCSIANAASAIPTVMPLGPITSPRCRFALAAVLQERLTERPYLKHSPELLWVRVSLMRGLRLHIQHA